MPRGTVLEYDTVRDVGFIAPDQPRRDGAAVRIDKKTTKSDSIRKGDLVEFSYGPYRLIRAAKIEADRKEREAIRARWA